MIGNVGLHKKLIAVIIIIVILIAAIMQNEYVIMAKNIYKQYTGQSLMYSFIGITYEGPFITPINPFILWLYAKSYRQVKKDLIAPLDTYITFSRLNFSPADRANCDWCSMVNGLIKLVVESAKFNENIAIPDIMRYYCKFALVFRKKSLDVKSFCQETFGKITPNLMKLSELYLLLEQIELRWCPFKAMANYYRNTNPSYIPLNYETIYAAGKILSKQQTIECEFCNKILNEEMDPKYISNDPKTSPMYSYYIRVLSM